MLNPQGTAPASEGEFPFDQNFTVNIIGGNYPHSASLVINKEQGTPVVRYRVDGKTKPILEQIVAIHPSHPSVGEIVHFQFTLDAPTPDQIAEGYIVGKYTFTFVPPGISVTSFIGKLNDPHKRNKGKVEIEDDDWIAKGGADDEVKY
jgi:hypothetical protein